MQRCQNKMTSLGRGDGEGNRLQIAHFSNHDHIWILPQRSAQRSSERFGVGEHFPLGNVTVFRFQNVFDRVLECNDVIVPFHVYLLDHRRQCSRFASSYRTSCQDQSVLITGENLEMLWQLQLIHGSDVGVDHAKDNFDPKPLPNHAGAVAGELVCVRKIRIAARIEFIFIDVGHKGFGQCRGVLGCEPRRVRPDWFQASMQTPSRPRVRG